MAQSKVLMLCCTRVLSLERCMSYLTGRWSPWGHWEAGWKREDLFCSLGLASSADELSQRLANFRFSQQCSHYHCPMGCAKSPGCDEILQHNSKDRNDTNCQGPMESPARSLTCLPPLPCFLSVCSLMHRSPQTSEPALQNHSPFPDTPLATTSCGNVP